LRKLDSSFRRGACVKKVTGKSGIAYAMRIEREYGKFLRLFVPFCGHGGSLELGRGRGGFAERGMATKNKDAGDAAQVEVFDLKQAQRGIGLNSAPRMPPCPMETQGTMSRF
jgi:hypothetical protein